ncbi:tRNA (adenosine(37)-N6)-threonylcarbamoyltransferase complex dimerization subunit type 1 TsaB [Xinfangfangia sp. CPCC 101601]|uniref:tRNA (Adenosine(37)-N6)-threonylcarbamoyltransferase complex dimerization subunit type 1 TsaB n=1 Tax=Pseudogemmobacter lacusdianii TaxID=3069608 RepID=A0ABU0VW05_9RHOB|nr:tRNA (adenosine(37)-N6)-threonylcarbamoyltransferase complex dimerization subunit type 1 TsaB [Xinfangfangia sp. CPCC 101601]MDQ2065930.1 tRNA (adenosine(37)-N6)-threonylcarbamoyltransferase complex dimerization subunit type 1 TsaB [Xinfangfangia sp. CPCC 101601]
MSQPNLFAEAPLLAFDTSAAHCAAALLLPDGRLISREEPMQKGQAERLVPLLNELMSEAGLQWSDLKRLAVGIGPGNFTGVRISVATARGFALALNIPAIGVTRLEALAHGLPQPLRVAEDARQGLAYVQDFPAGTARIEPLQPHDGPATGSAAGDEALPPAMPIAEAIARIAALRAPGAAPAPFYLKGADAAPPSDPPPVILPSDPQP